MKITNVDEIYDNGEFVSIVTETGSAVNLPKGDHSINVVYQPKERDDYTDGLIVVKVDLFSH